MAMQNWEVNAGVVVDENIKEEECIKKLFSRVLDIMPSQISVPEDSLIQAAYHDILDKFQSFACMTIDFNQPSYLYAYFQAFSNLNAAVARNRFTLAFVNCVQLREVINQYNMNIISLGGGPGTDMVGFLSAMKPYIMISNMSLKLTIAEICPQWGWFYNVLESLIRTDNYGHVSSIFQHFQVQSRFMPVDLRSAEQPREYISDLEKADIVLLARVLNILHFNEEMIVLENIVSKMKKGALLLIVDTRTGYEKNPDLEILYEDKSPYVFALTVPADMKFDIWSSTQSKCGIAVCRKK